MPSRWLAVRHAVAYVLGFGAVFTILGVTATFVGGPLADYLPALRTVGGLLLIVMGLNLAGILPHPRARPDLAALSRPARRAPLAQPDRHRRLRRAGRDGGPGLGERLGGRLVGGRGGMLASFGLGVVFAVGWTPCIGIILGSILTVAARPARRSRAGCSCWPTRWASASRSSCSALVYDRAPARGPAAGPPRPGGELRRRGPGGRSIGVLMLMDWLWLFVASAGSRAWRPGI